MSLYDDPPHTCTISSVTHAADTAGGHAATYATRQANVPCSINVTSGSEPDEFGQSQKVVSGTIAILTSALTADVQRGDKVTGSDNRQYHVTGLRKGLGYGDVPGFTYLDVRAIL